MTIPGEPESSPQHQQLRQHLIGGGSEELGTGRDARSKRCHVFAKGSEAEKWILLIAYVRKCAVSWSSRSASWIGCYASQAQADETRALVRALNAQGSERTAPRF